MLAQLEENYPEDLQVIYRHFPLLSIHDKAGLALQAAEAAGVQGAFWEMHDRLFAQQGEWGQTNPAGFENWLILQATEMGLDIEQFTQDMEAHESLAEEAWSFGQEVGLPGTPYLLINGNPYGGPLDYNSLESILKLYALQERQYNSCPPMVIDPLREYVATIDTEKGEIVLQLYADRTPLAVNSFVFLAREGWFDGVSFHRVIPGFVAQAGDPSGTGFGGPGYAFDNELVPGLTFDQAGVLAMANAGPGSNGSQFFITLDAQPDLDGSFTIFGEVIQGMGTVEALSARNPDQNPNLPPGDRILEVTIEER